MTHDLVAKKARGGKTEKKGWAGDVCWVSHEENRCGDTDGCCDVMQGRLQVIAVLMIQCGGLLVD